MLVRRPALSAKIPCRDLQGHQGKGIYRLQGEDILHAHSIRFVKKDDDRHDQVHPFRNLNEIEAGQVSGKGECCRHVDNQFDGITCFARSPIRDYSLRSLSH